MIDISKPIYAKIYDYDEAYCESDCDDTCGSYIIREVEELHFTTKRCEAFIRYNDGFVSKTFKLLPLSANTIENKIEDWGSEQC